MWLWWRWWNPQISLTAQCVIYIFSDNTARWRCSAFLITSMHQTSSQISQHFDYSFTVSRSFIIESWTIHSGNIQIIIGCDYKSLIEMLYPFDLLIWQTMYCSSVVRPYIGREYIRMSLACIEREHNMMDVIWRLDGCHTSYVIVQAEQCRDYCGGGEISLSLSLSSMPPSLCRVYRQCNLMEMLCTHHTQQYRLYGISFAGSAEQIVLLRYLY